MMIGYLPSSIPVTIEAKLSSMSIISAACLLTSDPVIPIAIPGNQKDKTVQKCTSICFYFVALYFCLSLSFSEMYR